MDVDLTCNKSLILILDKLHKTSSLESSSRRWNVLESSKTFHPLYQPRTVKNTTVFRCMAKLKKIHIKIIIILVSLACAAIPNVLLMIYHDVVKYQFSTERLLYLLCRIYHTLLQRRALSNMDFVYRYPTTTLWLIKKNVSDHSSKCFDELTLGCKIAVNI